MICKDGPPCLQAWECADDLPNDRRARQHLARAVIAYATQKYPDTPAKVGECVEGFGLKVRAETFDKPPAFPCRSVPLSKRCDRKACRGRRYGPYGGEYDGILGVARLQHTVPVSRITGEALPQYGMWRVWLAVDGVQVDPLDVTTSELCNPAKLYVLLIEQHVVCRALRDFGADDWYTRMLAPWIEDRCEVIEIGAEGSPLWDLAELLATFLRPHVVRADPGEPANVPVAELGIKLRREGFKAWTGVRLHTVLHEEFGLHQTTARIDGRVVRVWRFSPWVVDGFTGSDTPVRARLSNADPI